MMSSTNPICLGGGHGARSYLPQDLQRFSIDLDFYSNESDIHNVIDKIADLGETFELVGYGLESEGIFKRYDSAIPRGLNKCTAAFVKKYNQAFQQADVGSEFYVTISNISPITKYEMRTPKSYIGTEYVKAKIPVLPATEIIAGKIQIIPHRRVKDLYKDIFDVYCLLKLGDAPIAESEIVDSLSKGSSKIARSRLFDRFKETSSASNARSAIKLPASSRDRYLRDWISMNPFVRNETIRFLKSARMLSNGK